MRMLVFGATGKVGQGVIREGLRDDRVTEILAVVRSPSGTIDPKWSEIVLPDLSRIGDEASRLSGFDACLFCLGVSSVGMSEADYARVTHDLTMTIASLLAPRNPAMTFIFVSGAGTSRESRQMWARVKARTSRACRNAGGMAKKEKYLNFSELSFHETEGEDYRVRLLPIKASDVAVLAPHGGKIEFLTSRLARSIAAHDYNFYAFEGIKPVDNGDLHITSSHFDEPRALDLVASCRRVLTIHGMGGDEKEIQIGGLDQDLRARIDASLCAAGFASKVIATGRYAGIHPGNICNRGKSEAGVQIEVKYGMRRLLHGDAARYAAFVNAVRDAVAG